MNKKKICVLNDQEGGLVTNMLTDEGYEVHRRDTGSSLEDIEDHSLIIFCGGTDISTNLYGQRRESYTDLPDLGRDTFEVQAFTIAKANGIPMIGICRGAQLLNCLNGGSLIQHTSDHYGSHDIEIESTSEIIYAPANHHQVMVPKDNNYRLLASHNSSTEVVYYSDTKCLCHQPHPEWVQDKCSSKYYQWFFENIDNLLNNTSLH